jgi:predicted DCC family thiol-disulfide oxidoreductase YuxK
LSQRSSDQTIRLWIVYDGTCGFCARTARWLKARDTRGRIAVEYAQAEGCRTRFGLTLEETDRAAWAIDRTGRRWEGPAAINRALRQLGGLWPLIGALYGAPPIAWLEDRAYVWISRNRPLLSRLWGVAPPCEGCE